MVYFVSRNRLCLNHKTSLPVGFVFTNVVNDWFGVVALTTSMIAFLFQLNLPEKADCKQIKKIETHLCISFSGVSFLFDYFLKHE